MMVSDTPVFKECLFHISYFINEYLLYSPDSVTLQNTLNGPFTGDCFNVCSGGVLCAY